MKNFKGFTLIECIIAMAILGFASLIMAGIYGNVARMNRQNALVNTSLSNQMAHVEKYEDAETVKVEYKTMAGGSSTKANAKPPHQAGDASKPSRPYVQVTRDGTDQSYSYPVDVYTLYSRDNEDRGSDESGFNAQYADSLTSGTTEDEFNLRYRYVLGAEIPN